MTNDIDKTLDEIIGKYFEIEHEICGNCKHSWYSHYWNGGGIQENAGWDSCKTEGCTCQWKDARQERYTTIDETPFNEAKAKLKQLILDSQEDNLKLLYWKYKELNDQSVDMKFVEAYNILIADLKSQREKYV